MSNAAARWLVLLPPGKLVTRHEAARRIGFYRAAPLGTLLSRPYMMAYVDVFGRHIARRVGTYDVATLPVPYRGTVVPFPASLRRRKSARIFWHTLRLTSVVVLGVAFRGAMIVERADGAVIRAGTVPQKPIEILRRHNLLRVIAQDDFAIYMSAATKDGTSVMWSADSDSF